MPVVPFQSGETAEPKGYAINWNTAASRLTDLKEFLLNAPQIMDPERLQFLDEVYQEFNGEHTFY